MATPNDDSLDTQLDSTTEINEETGSGEQTPDPQEELSPLEAIASKITSAREQTDDIDDEELEEDNLSSDVDEGKADTDLFTVKVNGEERQVTEQELVKNYQIDSAARVKLEEAVLKEREVADKLAEVTAREAELIAQQAVTVPEPKQEAVDLDEVVTKLREGSDEEAVQAMKELTESLVSTTVAPEVPDVSGLVEQKFREIEESKQKELEQELAVEFETAESSFNSEFAEDLKTNSDFFELAAMEDRKLVQDPVWATKPVGDRLIEAGKRAQAWVSGSATVDKLQKRQQRKNRHGTTSTSSGRSKIGETTTQDTRQSVIAQMAKDRGQLV